MIKFVRKGQKLLNCSSKTRVGQQEAACDWNLLVELDHWLRIVSDLAISNLSPGMILWSTMLCKVFLIELIIL